jgi:hypothetical protein
MADFFSAVAQATIERGTLIAYLEAAPIPASRWTDWARIGGAWNDVAWDADLPAYLASVDERLTDCNRDVIRGLIEPDIAPGTQRCDYDAATQRFTFATLMFSVNLEDHLLFFATARGIAGWMRDDQTGFAVMQDYLWSAPPRTVAAMAIGPGGRAGWLDAQADAADHRQAAAAAAAVLDDIKAAGGNPDLVIDDLDELS